MEKKSASTKPNQQAKAPNSKTNTSTTSQTKSQANSKSQTAKQNNTNPQKADSIKLNPVKPKGKASEAEKKNLRLIK